LTGESIVFSKDAKQAELENTPMDAFASDAHKRLKIFLKHIMKMLFIGQALVRGKLPDAIQYLS
jgi:hypothetical protein